MVLNPTPAALKPTEAELYGTEEMGVTVDQRLERCYQITAYALVFGTAPAAAVLVHGNWQHVVYATERICHAWLRLPDGRVWEPIKGEIHERIVWDAVMRPNEERTYTQVQTRNALLFHGHFGPWHDSEYP